MRAKQELENLIDETKEDLRKARDRFNNSKNEAEQKTRHNLVNQYRKELQGYEKELAELDREEVILNEYY